MLRFPVWRRSFQRCGNRGFTLVEILVVMLLVALMAGAVIPLFGRRKEKEALRASALKLCDALAFCYSAAVTEARRYKWVWNEETRSWSCQREADPLEAPGEFRPVFVGGRRDETLPPRIEVEGLYFAVKQDVEQGQEAEPVELPPEINFYPDGHCDTADVVLQVAPSEGEEVPDNTAASSAEAMTITLNGITGRVKLLAGNAIAEELEAEEEAPPQTQLFEMESSP